MLGFDNLFSLDYWRKRYARVDVYDARNEVHYQAHRSWLSMAFRRVADLVGGLIENSADAISNILTSTVGGILQFILGPELARNMGVFVGGVGGKIAGVAGAGLASAVSAGFAQMDYIHQKRNLKDLYAEELAAKLGKPADQVTIEDMESLAEHNPALKEELHRATKQRNFMVPMAIIATLASVGVGALVSLAFPALAGPALWITKLAAGMVTYMATKTAGQQLGNKIFGLYQETANDRIVDIKFAHERGVAISAEDLLPVAVKLNPALAEGLKKEFGDKPYEDMAGEQKAAFIKKVNATIPLEKLAQDINSGAMKPTELVFATIGERSGVPPQVENAQPVAHHEPEPSRVSFREKMKLVRREPNVSFVDKVIKQVTAEPSVSHH